MPALEPQANRNGRWRVLFRAQIPFFLAAAFVAIITAFAVPDAFPRSPCFDDRVRRHPLGTVAIALDDARPRC
jgi:hypothetical protein